MNLFDTHCHLFLNNSRQYSDSPEKILARAKNVGVNNLILVGSDIEDSQKNIEFAQKHLGIYCACGIHPDNLSENKSDREENINIINELIKSSKVVALGEVGLDYKDNTQDLKIQKSAFIKFTDIAKQNKLPLIFHCRNAMTDMIEIIEKECQNLTFVMHCFTGNLSEAKKILDLGGMLGFTNIIGYPNNHELEKVVKEIPLERILIETDAPFLPPQTRRGTICEPSDIKFVAALIAQIKNYEIEKICKATTDNAKRFFNQ